MYKFLQNSERNTRPGDSFDNSCFFGEFGYIFIIYSFTYPSYPYLYLFYVHSHHDYHSENDICKVNQISIFYFYYIVKIPKYLHEFDHTLSNKKKD